jgi:phosphatidylglycerol:prolipoprotein diacylglycerol transferase
MDTAAGPLPVLFELGELQVRSYAFFLMLGIFLAYQVHKREVRRLGFHREPRHIWVVVGALVGAAVGAKLGMALFVPPAELLDTFRDMLAFDFTGKTVVGGIAGGYIGVELTKKLAGIEFRTGDAYAVALPLAQGFGRVGCFLHGCCYGVAWDGPWAVGMVGATRHPVQLYEAVLDLGLAALLWSLRRRSYPPGHLFRRMILGYALIRFAMEPLRGDVSIAVGPFTAVQLFCLVVAVGFTVMIVRGERGREESSA